MHLTKIEVAKIGVDNSLAMQLHQVLREPKQQGLHDKLRTIVFHVVR